MVGDGCEVCNPFKALEICKETIDDLTAQLVEAERERDSASFDKARMLDERQIFLKAMDELRAEVARLTEDAKCAWVNNGILERARQAQDAEIARLKARGDNHAETLRGIAAMPVEDGARMKLWATDGLSGCAPLPETLLDLSDKLNAEKQAREAAEKRLRELREDHATLAKMLSRYAHEVPLGHQPHMLAEPARILADAALAKSNEP
jgi:predicted nuclease with TOPRIM domain